MISKRREKRQTNNHSFLVFVSRCSIDLIGVDILHYQNCMQKEQSWQPSTASFREQLFLSVEKLVSSKFIEMLPIGSISLEQDECRQQWINLKQRGPYISILTLAH